MVALIAIITSTCPLETLTFSSSAFWIRPSIVFNINPSVVCVTGQVFVSLGCETGACLIPNAVLSHDPDKGRDRGRRLWGTGVPTRPGSLFPTTQGNLASFDFTPPLSRAPTNSLLHLGNSASPTLRDSSVCSTCVLASRLRSLSTQDSGLTVRRVVVKECISCNILFSFYHFLNTLYDYIRLRSSAFLTILIDCFV